MFRGGPLSALHDYAWPKASVPNLELGEDEVFIESQDATRARSRHFGIAHGRDLH
jgi:hypothetical protein